MSNNSERFEPRAEAAICLLLLAAFVGARLALILRCPVELYHPEEYIQLRLAGQLAAGEALGDLGLYARGNNGFDGGGAWLMSVLFVPVTWVLGATSTAVKAMALLWATAGAVLCAVLGRRLFGPGGAAATLAALLALPPASVIFSSICWATHVEGAVLAVALLLAFHVAVTTPGRLAAFALGVLLTLAPFFSPLDLLPAVGVLVALPWVLGKDVRGLAPLLVAGAVVGALPAVFVDLGGGSAGDTVGQLSSHLRSGGALGAGLRTLTAIPTYGVEWPDVRAMSHTWTHRLDGIATALGWGAVLGLAVAGVRGGRPRASRAVMGIIAVTAVGVPFFLGATDLALERRLVIVPILWALGVAHVLVVVGRRLPRGALLAGVLLTLGAVPTLRLALSAPSLQASFAPHRFAMIPAELPRDANRVAIETIDRSQLPVMARLLEDPRTADREQRTAALLGFNVATGGGRDPLSLPGAPCASVAAAERLSAEQGVRPISWEYFGEVAAIGCRAAERETLCAAAGEAADACRAGWARAEL